MRTTIRKVCVIQCTSKPFWHKYDIWLQDGRNVCVLVPSLFLFRIAVTHCHKPYELMLDLLNLTQFEVNVLQFWCVVCSELNCLLTCSVH